MSARPAATGSDDVVVDIFTAIWLEETELNARLGSAGRDVRPPPSSRRAVEEVPPPSRLCTGPISEQPGSARQRLSAWGWWSIRGINFTSDILKSRPPLSSTFTFSFSPRPGSGCSFRFFEFNSCPPRGARTLRGRRSRVTPESCCGSPRVRTALGLLPLPVVYPAPVRVLRVTEIHRPAPREVVECRERLHALIDEQRPLPRAPRLRSGECV
ncbi:hypothetical protein DFH09DRAFT_1136758 [Mycena vulgaris]|nr:hypothetical protein DFH09DRAFT_1136758 [Mycena vulgaris]